MLPLTDRVPVVVAAVFQLHLEGGRHGDKDVDGRGVDIVDDAKGLMPVRVLRDCCVVRVPRLPLPPLSDCVLVVVVAVVFWLHLEGTTTSW